MSNRDDTKTEESLVERYHIHYLITFILFCFILINTISLTIGTANMDVPSSDTNGMTAKNLMVSAEVITFVGLLTIIIFLIAAYSYSSNKNSTTYYEKMMGLTGTEDLYVAMRILTFSMLMFISIVDSALLLEAANYISMSDDPSAYNDEYNLCKHLGDVFFVHFIFFSCIQGISWFSEFYSGKSKKAKPINHYDNVKDSRKLYEFNGPNNLPDLTFLISCF